MSLTPKKLGANDNLMEIAGNIAWKVLQTPDPVSGVEVQMERVAATGRR
jgi:hypothetical protein